MRGQKEACHQKQCHDREREGKLYDAIAKATPPVPQRRLSSQEPGDLLQTGVNGAIGLRVQRPVPGEDRGASRNGPR